MRVTILAFGSHGDVVPLVALGVGLRDAGYEVHLAADAAFASLARECRLDFHPVAGDIRALMAGAQGRDLVAGGGGPAGQARRILAGIRPLVRDMVRDTYLACTGSDVLLLSGLALYPGLPVAEKLGIPYVQAYLQPVTPTRAFPSAMMPPPPIPLGGAGNLLTHALTLHGFWQTFRPAFNVARREVLGLPPVSPWGAMGARDPLRRPVLYGFSPHVVPRPADWGPNTQVTGYWFPPRPAGWHPPAALVDFLAAGPPPVYVGFGSMNTGDPAATTQLVVRALALAGRRGILAAGWDGLRAVDLPRTVLAFDSAPHDWLFPRMAAVVHHGGAGTTAAGLRAGVPTVTVPFFGDQPFWGARVAALGAGPPPLPRARLTARQLAAAIRAATEDSAMGEHAARLGERIRAEDGIARAVDLFGCALRD